jgi:hypothetical protein
MKKVDSDEMRAQYDFAGGVRGKYLPRLAKGTNVVFPTSKAVNDALRVLAEAGKRHAKTKSSRRSA